MLSPSKKGIIHGSVEIREEKSERRRAIRVCSMNFINIDPEKDTPVIHGLGRTLELNLEGATIEVADELPVGTVIAIELAMGEVITTLKGEVKNILPSVLGSGLYRVGIEFLKPDTVRLE